MNMEQKSLKYTVEGLVDLVAKAGEFEALPHESKDEMQRKQADAVALQEEIRSYGQALMGLAEQYGDKAALLGRWLQNGKPGTL